MQKQIILHIGTYKTGTKSIQRFLVDHARRLSKQGIALYRGQFGDENLELCLAALRYERDAFAKLGICKHITFDANFTMQVAERIQQFMCRRREPCFLFTSESLCLLRYDDEIKRLATILDAENADVKVVIYLRNKADFLRSYKTQLLKVSGRQPSKDPRSSLYVAPDSWLTDYDSLIATYQRGFGATNVVVIDYDAEVQREGNVIPSFLRELRVEQAAFGDASTYFLNTTNRSEAKSPKKRWSQRLQRTWNKWRRRRAA